MAAETELQTQQRNTPLLPPGTPMFSHNPSTQRPGKKQLQAADDYHKMKEFYYERYMSQLRDKILEYDKKPSPSSSRKSSIKSASQSPSAINAPKRGPAAEPRVRRPVHKPLKLSTPKSRRLTMLEAEDKLTKGGYIQTEDDLMEFRNGVAGVDDLDMYTESYMAKKRVRSAKSASARRSTRPLSNIAESREQSARPKSIPQKQMGTNLNPLGGNKMVSPADIAKAAAAALEKRCPRMDIPALHCLREESGDSDGESEIARDEERGRRRDEYSTHVAYLRQMYQRAQANAAQAKRIIDGREDDILQDRSKLHLISDLSNLCDVISPVRDVQSYHKETDDIALAYDPQQDIPNLSDTEDDDSLVPPPTYDDSVVRWGDQNHTEHTTRQPFGMFTPIEEEPNTPPPVQSQALVPVSDQSQSMKLVATNQDSPAAGGDSENVVEEKEEIEQQPLNMKLMESEVKVIESKAMSTYWNNYLHVGRSKFARDDKADDNLLAIADS